MKTRNVRITTPAGIARWPHLNEPDTKFNKDGDYKVNLLLGAEDTEKLRSSMQEVLQKFIAEGNAKTKKVAPLPIKEATDAEGNPTGQFEIKFKLRAVGVSRGERWEQRPALFDAQGKPMTELVGNGSKVKVGAEIVPYSTAISGTGVTLRLRAVQVLELKTVAGGDAFDSWEFGRQDGFQTTGATPNATEQEDDDNGGYDW